MDDDEDVTVYSEEDLSVTHDDNLMRKLLFESLEREKELQKFLDDEILKNDQLKLKLEIEMKKKEIIEDDDSESDEAEKALGNESSKAHEDLKETFGTNSSILMQYKYDELREAYSKCVKKLCGKSKQLKRVLQEAELEKFKNIQLSSENIELNKKIEEVCYRFLRLLDRRNEEKTFFTAQIKELQWKLMEFSR